MAPTIVEIPREVLERFTKLDQYHNSFLLRLDEGLEYALERNAENGHPDISVAASQGRFLKLMALAIGAKRALEVGTLGGCSTIWMGQSLPEDGELITLEVSEVDAKIARENLARAGIRNARVMVGDVKEILASLPTEEPFDLVSIDANKEGYPNYFLERNIWSGRVADESFARGCSRCGAVRTLLEMLKEDGEVVATTIAIANVKGYDGFLYAIKL
ncbi:O-methyltransferase family 3 protein [Pisolithus croceorrhizus]|nr:O-methyltransferase family 3 protein [Pisolithus croceorrhizus]KAI6109335.1 O-methyltransferase family 3 protein [Pisolithus croceorrhizus]KAI6147580.1 O-methyltransferase family 3 protein [Pisolithus thermaeus]